MIYSVERSRESDFERRCKERGEFFWQSFELRGLDLFFYTYIIETNKYVCMHVYACEDVVGNEYIECREETIRVNDGSIAIGETRDTIGKNKDGTNGSGRALPLLYI